MIPALFPFIASGSERAAQRAKLGSLGFNNDEAARDARGRLEQLSTVDLAALFRCIESLPDPHRTLANLERWLAQVANPSTYLDPIALNPRSAIGLLTLMGAGQSIADLLIQNPELASLAEPNAEPLPTRDRVVSEGRRLLAHADSHSHRMDRLRFLKQRFQLPILVADLLPSRHEPEYVWRAISEVADGILELAAEVAWEEQKTTRGYEGASRLSMVAFGKHGGHELNYSSDIDLVFILADDATEQEEKQAVRYAEAFGRVLAERMGRGALYRLDLRLRPFGAAGPLTPTMRAVEAYYRSHAELWEVQALLRTRVVIDPAGIADRWNALVERSCYSHPLSELSFESLIENRNLVEQHAAPDDLKRGPGGIRDVEFLTQILQLVHGASNPEVRVVATPSALTALKAAKLIPTETADQLLSGYRFLRTLEHRIQMADDLQTHALPIDPSGRTSLARNMGFQRWEELEAHLDHIRTEIRDLYRQTVGDRRHDGLSNKVAVAAGEAAPTLRRWFDSLPEPEAFYSVLAENADSLARVIEIVHEAPLLIPRLQRSVALTEGILSGEIEETEGFGTRLSRLPATASEQQVAVAFSDDWATEVVRWTLREDSDLGHRLSGLVDALLKRLLASAPVAVLALGSYGMEELGIESDADLILLTPDEDPSLAEGAAQEFLATVDRLRRFGLPLSIDLRLRPEGGKGLLVRTYPGFAQYELEAMEMWERFAIGQTRLVCGDPAALALVQRAAFALPLTPERLRELVAMKRRIETERVPTQLVKRDIKLGFGGISDLDWLVHLHQMRYPTATHAGRDWRWSDRLHRLAEARLLNSFEVGLLTDARIHLQRVRAKLKLMRFEADVLPENPDKLSRLAVALGFDNGNDFLASHTRHTEAVRQMFLEGLERLRA